MKLGYMLVAPLVFSFCAANFARAEDKVEVKAGPVEVKARAGHGKHEYKMRVTRKGDHYVGSYDNHEYVLRGDAASRFNAEGDYVVYGDIGTDGTYIETSDFEPAGIRVAVGSHEFRMRVGRRGDHYVGFYNNREYVLRGDAVSHINADGEYVVHGDIGPDDTFITTTEVQPVVVHEREVIIEKREPFIKVGPLEIGR